MIESPRQSKVSKLVQMHLSEILQRELFSDRGMLLTVSMVRTSPDLGLCKVYISVFPSEKRDEILEFLETENWRARKLLAGRIRNKLKSVPELNFYADDTLDYVEKMDELFDKIKSDKSSEEE